MKKHRFSIGQRVMVGGEEMIVVAIADTHQYLLARKDGSRVAKVDSGIRPIYVENGVDPRDIEIAEFKEQQTPKPKTNKEPEQKVTTESKTKSTVETKDKK